MVLRAKSSGLPSLHEATDEGSLHVSNAPIAGSIEDQLATHDFTNLAQGRHQSGGDASIPLGRQVNAVGLQHSGLCR
jgi:hypothetical protein